MCSKVKRDEERDGKSGKFLNIYLNWINDTDKNKNTEYKNKNFKKL